MINAYEQDALRRNYQRIMAKATTRDDSQPFAEQGVADVTTKNRVAVVLLCAVGVCLGMLLVAVPFLYVTYYAYPEAVAYCAKRGLAVVSLGRAGLYCADPRTGAVYARPRDEL